MVAFRATPTQILEISYISLNEKDVVWVPYDSNKILCETGQARVGTTP